MLRARTLVFCIGVAGLLACAGDDKNDAGTALKRLYQTGCTMDAECENSGVCHTEGTMKLCLASCAACSKGSCESGACVPSCSVDMACPDTGLTCVASRCVPSGSVTGPDLRAGECSPSVGCQVPASYDCILNGMGTGSCGLICNVAGGVSSADCAAAGGVCSDVSDSGQVCRISCGEADPNCPRVSQAIGMCIEQICGYTPPA